MSCHSIGIFDWNVGHWCDLGFCLSSSLSMFRVPPWPKSRVIPVVTWSPWHQHHSTSGKCPSNIPNRSIQVTNHEPALQVKESINLWQFVPRLFTRSDKILLTCKMLTRSIINIDLWVKIQLSWQSIKVLTPYPNKFRLFFIIDVIPTPHYSSPHLKLFCILSRKLFWVMTIACLSSFLVTPRKSRNDLSWRLVKIFLKLLKLGMISTL